MNLVNNIFIKQFNSSFTYPYNINIQYLIFIQFVLHEYSTFEKIRSGILYRKQPVLILRQYRQCFIIFLLL